MKTMLRKLTFLLFGICLTTALFGQSRTVIGPQGFLEYDDVSPKPRDVFYGDTLGLGLMRMLPDSVVIPNDTGVSTSVEIEDEYGIVACKQLDTVCEICNFESLAFVRKCTSPAFISIAQKIPLLAVGTVDIGSAIYDYENVYAKSFINTTLLRTSSGDLETLDYGLETVLKMRPVINRAGTERIAGSRGIGFEARELRKVVPELVPMTEDNEPAGIRLNGMFPIMISSIQELAEQQEEIIATQADQIATLQAQLDAISQQLSQLAGSGSPGNFSYLAQNIPNPFNQRSTIAYYLAEDAARARMLFYRTDSGVLVKEIDLDPAAGKATAEVSTVGFSSGSYVYSLEIDGRVIDSKIMIVQE